MPADTNTDDGLFVNLIPGFDQLEQKLDDKEYSKEIQIESEDQQIGADVMPDEAPEGEAGTETGGGITDMAGSIGEMAGTLGVIAGAVGLIAGVVSGLPQVQALLSIITSILQLALLPFINMLFTFLKPVLIGLMKLIPVWLKTFGMGQDEEERARREQVQQLTERFGGNRQLARATQGVREAKNIMDKAIAGLTDPVQSFEQRTTPVGSVFSGLISPFSMLTNTADFIAGLQNPSGQRNVNVTQNFRTLSPEAQNQQMNHWQEISGEDT